MGLKTTYYLRTLAASQVEKSTTSTKDFGATHSRDFSKDKIANMNQGQNNNSIPSPISVNEIVMKENSSTPSMAEVIYANTVSGFTKSDFQKTETVSSNINTSKVSNDFGESELTPLSQKKYKIHANPNDEICEGCSA